MRSGLTAAFTLTELCVVIIGTSILILFILPALASNKSVGKNAGCLSNLRRMQVAWEMYRTDSHDILMPNAPMGTSGAIAWINGNTTAENWGNSVGNTNTAAYAASIISRYLNSNISVLRCPADVVPSANGTRLRSYSMNGQMGTIYLGSVQNSGTLGFRTYAKGSDLVSPSPANAFVFLDEAPGSIDDGYFQMDFINSDFPNVPAAYMEGGCGCSFADGHAEIHRWQTASLEIPVVAGVTSRSVRATGASNADWIWLTQHSASIQ